MRRRNCIYSCAGHFHEPLPSRTLRLRFRFVLLQAHNTMLLFFCQFYFETIKIKTQGGLI